MFVPPKKKSTQNHFKTTPKRYPSFFQSRCRRSTPPRRTVPCHRRRRFGVRWWWLRVEVMMA